MRKISAFTLSLTFTGCFLGAGYVSGQELYQFFGAFGIFGYIGLFVAVALLAVLNMIIIHIVSTTNNAQIDKTVVGSDNKLLLFSVGALENIIFFGTYVVMAAGAGALAENLTGINNSHIIGSLVFCLIISFLAVKGIKGLVKIFSAVVPVLVVLTVAIGIFTIATNAQNGFLIEKSSDFNILIPNWIAGAVTFSTYNLFCSIGVLCPVGLQTKSKSSALLGTLLGCVFLVIVALSVLLSFAVIPEASLEELPMLAISESISPVLMYVYACLLFLAMSGASLACLIPTVTYLSNYSKTAELHGAALTFIISGIAFLLSCFGFADLVGTLFSSFGYISILGVIGLVLHCFKLRKYKKDL